MFEPPLHRVPDVVDDDIRRIFGFAAGKDAAAHQNRMPCTAAEAGVLVRAEDIASGIIYVGDVSSRVGLGGKNGYGTEREM